MAGMVPGLRAASTDCSATRDVVGWPTAEEPQGPGSHRTIPGTNGTWGDRARNGTMMGTQSQ